jgi:cell division protein FtsQ
MDLKKHFFFASVFIMILLLSSFAHLRNDRRYVKKMSISFKSEVPRFLNDSLVNKLLIQNKGELPWKAKDSLVLNMLEALLEKNSYVDNAEVFHFQQGILGVSIQEKTAVVRVQSSDPYYLDKSGDYFPLSKNYTPKVPLFMGTLKEAQKHRLLSLIDQFNADPFLRDELASIHYRSGSYFVGLRSYGFEVELGTLGRMSEKLSKLKVFCAYLNNHPVKRTYTLINLKFKNQVVGS